MQQYDQLHFFLDESGDLSRESSRDLLLVGGLIVFGPYNQADDKSLRRILKLGLEKAGGKFPADLHFADRRTGISNQSLEEMFRSLSKDLKDWCGEERRVYGVHLVHKEDVFSGTTGILAEREFDNRYLSMVWSLIEHLVFVDEKIAERLTPDAELHLHIANRVFVFDPKVVSLESLESLGFHCRTDRWNQGKKMIGNTLNEREVVAMMRMSFRQRWQSPPVHLKSVNVISISYDGDNSRTPAALYLADMYLGPIRRLIRSPHSSYRVKSVLIPTFRELHYGPWLESLARMQVGIQAKDLDQYLTNLTAYLAAADRFDSSKFAFVTNRQERAAAQLMRENPSRILNLLQEAAQTVDLPGLAARGLAQAEQVERFLRVTGDDDLTSRVLLLLVKLSHANHTGNIQVADEIWGDYLEIEPRLPTLGIDGLNLVAAIRNRRAVSLTDRFLYEEALGVLLHVVSERETLLETMANLYGVPVDQLPRQQLGECLGSLGQVYAFLGTETTHPKAVECFRRAAALFQSPRDRERQLVYLGHLACDMGDAGRPLWEEAISEISKLGSDKSEFRSGEQFLLALWLKGKLVFGDKSQVRSFLQNLPPSTTLLKDFSPEEQRNHPFGLIHQTIAMLFAQAWEQTPEEPLAEKALEEFELASQLMSHRAGVLKLLGQVAECRRTLFRLCVSKESRNQRKKLALQLRAVLGLLAENFSPGGWDEDEEGQATGWFGDRDPGTHRSIPERVESLLTGIRFNYW